MTTIDGLPACSCLAEWIPAFEKKIGRNVAWRQLVGDAPASAGFHKGGGSADCGILSTDELRVARNMGGAAWNRFWVDNHHCHIRLNGCPHNTVAAPQVEDLNEGRDGTGPLYDNAGAPDNGPRDGVHWPLRTWRQGIEWSDDVSAADVFKWPVMDAKGTDATADDEKVTFETAIRRTLSLAYANRDEIAKVAAAVEALNKAVAAISLGGIDIAALAKAVNDDAARRLAE